MPTKKVNWSNEQVLGASREIFLFAQDKRKGALGYKVSRVQMALEPIAKAITEQSLTNRALLQREIDGKRVPFVQDGQDVDPVIWCTDPEEFRRQEKELLAVTQEIEFAHWFVYEELSNLDGVRPEFFTRLNDLIEPPPEKPAKQ